MATFIIITIMLGAGVIILFLVLWARNLTQNSRRLDNIQ